MIQSIDIIVIAACKVEHPYYTYIYCYSALSFHVIWALINSYICAVWKELEKENKEFFETYTRDRAERNIEAETMQRIQKMLAEAAASKTSDDES